MPERAACLGVVLAGGQSRRFGTDKALADVGGIPLIEKAVYRLTDWFDEVAIVGRQIGPATCIPDWPKPGMGPLGGIAGALKYASDNGFASILTIPVDAIKLPDGLPQLLNAAPAYVHNAPTLAHWPVSALATVEEILTGDGKHSLRALVAATQAKEVRLTGTIANINTPEDLAQLAAAAMPEKLPRKPE